MKVIRVILSAEFIRTINEAKRIRIETKQIEKDIKDYEKLRTYEGIDLVKLDNLLTQKRNELEQISA